MITSTELTAISHAAVGLTGADIEAIVKRARGRARRAKRTVEAADVHAELDAVFERSGGFSEPVLEALAFHAAARAVVIHATDAGTVRTIALDPNGLRFRMEEANAQDPEMDLRYADEQTVERAIVTLMAGRASESLLGRHTMIHVSRSHTGDDLSDLDTATALAIRLELLSTSDGSEPIGFGGVGYALLHTVNGLRERVAKRLERARRDAERLVQTFEREVREAARMIRTERVVEGKRIEELLHGNGGAASDTHARAG